MVLMHFMLILQLHFLKKLIFAIEEERLNRIKNWFGFPFLSLQYILENYKIDLNNDISSINFNFDSNQNFAFKFKLSYPTHLY